jgi:glycosyltransferase involved in cell wall biosynthesis
MNRQILVDAREFVPGKITGIGRFLEGLVDALTDAALNTDIVLTSFRKHSVPKNLLKKRTKLKEVPSSLISSEKVISDLTRTGVTLLLSPYPKLPLFGTYCKALNTVHDVLDLTHPAYRKRLRTMFDRFRFRKALKQASLTWYVSEWSLKETQRYLGVVGKNPRVRYSPIDARFRVTRMENENKILKEYQLKTGYVLVIGNGLPHKNLGVLLNIANSIPRELVFVGAAEKNKKYWQSTYQNAHPKWLPHVSDEDLPAIIRAASCLAQPSTAEGYGYPPLEAMACGIPCVVSNIPVLKETTGGNALYADPNNSKEWIEAFQSLDNNTTYKSQIEKGLKWIEPLSGTKGWHKHIADIQQVLDL